MQRQPAILQCIRRGQGAPVVLLHGLSLGAGMWDRLASVLVERGFEAIAVQARGHGTSPAVDAEADLDDFAGDVAAFLGRERINRPHLIGFSMGGMMAMRLAASGLPLASLTLVSTSAQEDPNREPYEATAEFVRRHGLDESGARMFVEMLCAPGFLDEHRDVLDRFRAMILRNDRIGVYRASLAVVRRPDILGRLGAITAPTLIVCGEHDLATPPACSVAMAGAIAGAKLVTLSSAAHLLTEEQPEAFAQAVVAHLQAHP